MSPRTCTRCAVLLPRMLAEERAEGRREAFAEARSLERSFEYGKHQTLLACAARAIVMAVECEDPGDSDDYGGHGAAALLALAEEFEREASRL